MLLEFSGIFGSHRNMAATNPKSSSAITMIFPNFYKKVKLHLGETTHHTCTIKTRSGFETTLDYKLKVLDPKIEELPCLVH